MYNFSDIHSNDCHKIQDTRHSQYSLSIATQEPRGLLCKLMYAPYAFPCQEAVSQIVLHKTSKCQRVISCPQTYHQNIAAIAICS